MACNDNHQWFPDGDLAYDGENVMQEVICRNCGATGTRVWLFDAVYNIEYIPPEKR